MTLDQKLKHLAEIQTCIIKEMMNMSETLLEIIDSVEELGGYVNELQKKCTEESGQENI